jgi:putative membrane protein
MHMVMGPMMGWAWMILWPVFLAALVVGVVFVVQILTGNSTGSAVASTASAMQILEERFARGEIDRDEFEERRRALQS